MHTDASADLSVFPARVRRLGPAAVVRLRPDAAGGIRIGRALPFAIPAPRRLPGHVERGVTVRAADLFGRLSDEGHCGLPWPATCR